MAEAKDPTIKLFGMTIPLQEISSSTTTASASTTTTTVSPSSSAAAAAAACHLVLDYDDDDDDDDESGEDQERPSCASYSADTGGEERGADKDAAGDSHTACMEGDEAPPVTSEKSSNPDATSLTSENPKTPSIEKDSNTSKTAKTEDEQSDTSNSQEKTLKKPDKVIPCPRCNSMDTKFCYYNNYNVNQPRHFCKNCQRYWTAGGTMRNVPVGAGRRKNKNSASHYRHITIPEGLQNIRNDVPNGIHHPALKTNGTVLSFGSETPLHESMDSVLNLADKPMRNCTQNGFHKTEALRIPVSHGRGESGDAHFSSVPSSNTKDEAGTNGPQEPVMQNYQGFSAQMPCFPGGPWPYPWGSPVPPPGFCPPGYPMPFYPAPAYWGCTVPGTWNIPWLPQSVSPKQTAGSGPNSPTLGKHSRDEIALKANNSGEEEPSKENSTERSLWIPKTLRIDDPGEAAKSSIWTTLGIKHDTTDTIGGKGLFKAFQSKSDEKKHTTETSPVLQANPAAMSRSLKFQESS